MTKDINVIQKQFIVSMNGRIWSVNIIKIPDIYIYYKKYHKLVVLTVVKYQFITNSNTATKIVSHVEITT